MKVSLVTTCLNEQSQIETFLNSAISQTKLPDELVIVDAGSTDHTVERIKRISKNAPLPIKLIVRSGNRSVGRNIGISEAKHQIIAESDVGCQLHADWLEQITKPFTKADVSSVAGFYNGQTKNALAQVCAPFLVTNPKKLDSNTFLPSSRSVAFRKTVFASIGGYNAQLDYCEDLEFAQRLKQEGGMVVNEKALVDWPIPTSITDFFGKIHHYTTGNVQAKYWPHLKKNLTVPLRYVLFYLFPPMLVLYFAYVIFKHRQSTKPNLWWLLPLVQLTSDLAVVTGLIAGLRSTTTKSYNNHD